MRLALGEEGLHPSVSKQTGLVEQINDNDGPIDPALFEHVDTSTNKKVEIIDDGMAPLPFDSAQFEEGTKILSKGKADVETGRDEESIIVPTHEGEIPEQGGTSLMDNEGGDDEQRLPEVDAYAQAYAVEDDVPRNQQVIPDVIAEPMLPWYKQHVARLILGLVFIIVVVLSIALGLSLSSNDDPDSKPVPPSSTIPTQSPSTTSSSTIDQYVSLSLCAGPIVSGRQTIDLQLDYPHVKDVSDDGSNMVVLVQDGGYDSQGKWQGSEKGVQHICVNMI